MFILSSTKNEPNELKFDTLDVLGVGILQLFEAMQIMGVESENVRGDHENLPKFTSKVNYLCQL